MGTGMGVWVPKLVLTTDYRLTFTNHANIHAKRKAIGPGYRVDNLDGGHDFGAVTGKVLLTGEEPIHHNAPHQLNENWVPAPTKPSG